ncbi:helix-turn-helix domain-containing protein [Dermabacter hominis]|uniref:helix-turn-helix domain-containing protein n=1 Tax=Dermabacter hominis TaxID=36740 RepID=UPI003B8A613F
MAQVAHISGRHLARVFNESYGLPPVQFLAALRAKEMARLLREKPGWSVEAGAARSAGTDARMPATSLSANSGSRPMSTGGGLMVWIWPHLDRNRTRTPPTPRRTHYRVAMREGCVR